MFSETKVDKIIKYKGGQNHITILAQVHDKLAILFARTNGMALDITTEDIFPLKISKTAKIEIPINCSHTNLYRVILVEKESDFDIVDKVISSIWED